MENSAVGVVVVMVMEKICELVTHNGEKDMVCLSNFPRPRGTTL